MTHDTLCPWRVAEESDSALRFLAGVAVCECYLIAKVRENERDAALQRVEALRYGPQEMYEVAEMYHAAIAAIKGES